MNKTTVISLFCAALTASAVHAQNYDTNNESVTTFAGYGIPDYVDGQGIYSAFSSPQQIVADSAGNLYVWDAGNVRIRKIAPGGTVTTFAGGGSYFEGYGTNVSFAGATGGCLAIDHKDKLWLTLTYGYGGQWYLVSVSTNAYVNFENGGLTDLSGSSGLCFDSADNLYYSGGNRIYRYNTVSQSVQPFAGNTVAGNFDGQGTVFATFNDPTALACDQADNLYVWDSGNHEIRRIDQSQNVTTLAGNANGYYSNADGIGTNATFSVSYGGSPSLFTDHNGNVYFATGIYVRKLDTQTNVVTVAGSFNISGFANGPGSAAEFYNLSGGCFSQGSIFLADTGNNRIRQITFNQGPQVVPPASLILQTYPGLQITGAVGRAYQVQTSPDMSAWTPAAKVVLTSNPYLWVDSTPTSSGKKFYRAVLLP